MIVVEPGHFGRGLSAACVGIMRGIAADHGLPSLVAPVRPTEKPRYPLIPMDDYAGWRRTDGSLFDPWLGVHERLGGIGARIAPESMTVRGTVAEWETWTGLSMPQTGTNVVPGGLVPVEIDRERVAGVYLEPNCWMVHRARCPPIDFGGADPDSGLTRRWIQGPPRRRGPSQPVGSRSNVVRKSASAWGTSRACSAASTHRGTRPGPTGYGHLAHRTRPVRRPGFVGSPRREIGRAHV